MLVARLTALYLLEERANVASGQGVNGGFDVPQALVPFQQNNICMTIPLSL